MAGKFLDMASTPDVLRRQEQDGSDGLWNHGAGPNVGDELTLREASFITARDSFYLASVSESNWPYVQHRGGPKGFLKVLDSRTLAFADFMGNRQFISTGNLDGNNRSCLFLMDYPHRLRLKMFAHIDIVEAKHRQDLIERVVDSAKDAKVSRIFLVHVAAFDWNCPRYITPRYRLDEIEAFSV